MSEAKSDYRAVLAADLTLVLVSFIWGAGIPLSAVLARELTPLWAVALRMLLAAVFLIILFPKVIAASTLRDWKISFIQTLILVCVFVSMTFGLVYSTASKQAFIGGLNVIMVPLFVWGIYRLRPSAWIFAGAAITTAGLLVMGFTPGMEFNFGDFLSFIMAVFYALQVLGAGYCSRRVEPVRLVALHIIMLAVILTALALTFEPIPAPAAFAPKILWSLLCVSLCNTVLCFILQFKAQKVTTDTHAAVIFSLEGLFGYIIAVVSGQDPFHLQGALGGLLIIIGMLITELEGLLKAKTKTGKPEA
ncbi:MAG: DMT family transporter [Synergistaceae bacterium]|nr:DMT family transporter [Synergistaceae bacterium]